MSNLITNLLRTKKGVVTLQNMVIWPQKLKNHVFGVKYPFFHLLGRSFFSEEVSNPIINLFCYIEVGVPHQKVGIWPKKHDFRVFDVIKPFFEVRHPLFCYQKICYWILHLLRKKTMHLSSKKMANRPLKHPKMHFSPKAPEERFSFGHILSREVTWTFKNQVPTLLMHLDPEGCHGG